MRTFKEIVFDLDGTLIDTMPTYAAAFVTCCSGLIGATPATAREYYLRTAGVYLDDQFSGFFREIGHPISPDLVASLVREFRDVISRTPLRLFDSAIDVINFFAQLDAPPRLSVSSSSHNAREKLARLQLLASFAVVLGGNDGRKGYEHFRRLAAAAGRPIASWAQMACFVGDGTHDMEIAREFGLFAIGVAHTLSRETLIHAGADLVVDRIADLPRAYTAL